MSDTSTDPVSRQHIVRTWLLIVAALIVITLIVGGATRLTESGLSIVEWKPITGIVPPLDEPAWQAEFDKYKAIPQYRELNRGMSLQDFKVIYWWEWTHRALARFVGIAFLIPFLVFLWRGWIEPRLQVRLWAIFGLGGALGVIGWWMVSSGLTDRTSVSQYRLAFHLTLASVIYAAILWTAQSLVPAQSAAIPRRMRREGVLLLLLVVLQIYLGALVAGSDAGLVFNTWPMIDGTLLPNASRLFFERPLWRNFFENALTVQFDHRVMAYLLWGAALLHLIGTVCAREGRAAVAGAAVLAAAITLQAGVGIATLLYQVPLPLALLHQSLAIVVLTIAVVHAEWLLRGTPSSAGVKAPAQTA